VHRAAVAPDGRTDRTHAGPAGALLLPQLFAAARHLAAHLGFVRAAVVAGLKVPYRFIQERVVDLGREYFVGQFQLADLLVLQIHYIHCRYAVTSWTSVP